jgi:hypothetical protein
MTPDKIVGAPAEHSSSYKKNVAQVLLVALVTIVEFIWQVIVEVIAYLGDLAKVFVVLIVLSGIYLLGGWPLIILAATAAGGLYYYMVRPFGGR